MTPPELVASPPEPPTRIEVPEEILGGIGYLGRFREAWNTSLLLEPKSGRIFMALREGASRQQLETNPDLALPFRLDELLAGRMVRERQGLLHPAFPLIQNGNRQAFERIVGRTVDRLYPELRPALKKVRKLAVRSQVLPWLYALVWSEVFGSKQTEELLSHTGGLDPLRLRNEGYLWVLAPADPWYTAVQRYGSGSWTLHYVWNHRALPHPVLSDMTVRRTLLDRARNGEPWDLLRAKNQVMELGLLDSDTRVSIPALAEDHKLLTVLRRTSKRYARRVREELEPDLLARRLEVDRDEVFAAALVTVGSKILERAEQEELILRPPYLADQKTPKEEVYTTLVVTEDAYEDPLEKSYYLYDGQDFDGSIRQAELYLEEHPRDPEALFRKGIALMKKRSYERALAVFEDSMAQPAGPDDIWRGWTHIRAGNVLDVLQRREEALRHYREALAYASVAGSHQVARQWLERVYRD